MAQLNTDSSLIAPYCKPIVELFAPFAKDLIKFRSNAMVSGLQNVMVFGHTTMATEEPMINLDKICTGKYPVGKTYLRKSKNDYSFYSLSSNGVTLSCNGPKLKYNGASPVVTTTTQSGIVVMGHDHRTNKAELYINGEGLAYLTVADAKSNKVDKICYFSPSSYLYNEMACYYKFKGKQAGESFVVYNGKLVDCDRVADALPPAAFKSAIDEHYKENMALYSKGPEDVNYGDDYKNRLIDSVSEFRNDREEIAIFEAPQQKNKIVPTVQLHELEEMAVTGQFPARYSSNSVLNQRFADESNVSTTTYWNK